MQDWGGHRATRLSKLSLAFAVAMAGVAACETDEDASTAGHGGGAAGHVDDVPDGGRGDAGAGGRTAGGSSPAGGAGGGNEATAGAGGVVEPPLPSEGGAAGHGGVPTLTGGAATVPDEPYLVCPAIGEGASVPGTAVPLDPDTTDFADYWDASVALADAFGCSLDNVENPARDLTVVRISVTEPTLFVGYATYSTDVWWEEIAVVADCGSDQLLTPSEAGIPAAWEHPWPLVRLLEPGAYALLSCESSETEYVLEEPATSPDTNLDCAHAKPLFSGLQPRVLDDSPRFYSYTVTEPQKDPEDSDPFNVVIPVTTLQTSSSGTMTLHGQETGYTVSDYWTLHNAPEFTFNVPPDEYCIEFEVTPGTRYSFP